ncbi:hypothetical protein [Planktothricoides sp. SR001]|uniref:hypothetical protein n=1 Tax=Planktothricoides sp. SR001 TaxID=1705388 RepID=UPI0012E220EA|nr:hypothetical protein [Planktothricoides sp. SR001]
MPTIAHHFRQCPPLPTILAFCCLGNSPSESRAKLVSSLRGAIAADLFPTGQNQI